MKKQIIEILTKGNKAYTANELSDLLKIRDIEGFKKLLKELNSLIDNFEVYHTNKDKYMLFDQSNLRHGKFIGNRKGFGFVDIAGDIDVFVAPNNTNGAIHGDEVVVELMSNKSVDMEGRIVKIFSRNVDQLVGEFYYKGGVGYISFDDSKISIRAEIDPSKTKGAMNGHKVVVKLTDKKLKNGNYSAEVIKILGHKNDPGVDILSIVYKLGINDKFDDAVMKELDKIPLEVMAKDLENRIDLRDEEIFTIDGDDAKDLDDAVSLKMLANGNYLLGVHIADVASYVKIGTEIFNEAMMRGTSVYLADRVIPMLPHKLSNGICSLNGGVDRLALSCSMEIDAKGNVVNHEIYKSVINSKLRMTYKKANEVIEKNNLPEGYEPFAKTLHKMLELAHILRKNKEEKGMIDFQANESKLIVDDKGEIIDIQLRERGEAERLIEDFMIIANSTVANRFKNLDLPFIYRVHDVPKPEKIQNFLRFVSLNGYKLEGKINTNYPKSIQKILDQLVDKPEFVVFSDLLLRSMSKAVYSKNNIGHYGLALEDYCHFTSPIRRFPDTIVHHLLHIFIINNDLSKKTIEYWDEKLVFIAQHSSEKERAAVECEREVDDMKKAEYMAKHIGEEFEGMVSGVTSFGFFIQLPNLVEGLVKLDYLNEASKDKYFYDEESFSIRSLNNTRGFRIGDKLKITVTNANKELRTIDFMVSQFVKQKTK